ncbi:Glycoside Hydrolase Family 20 protein [Trametes cinnabarina]|uniref:Beta-hexosaminidase n=1 Tax=Pycnoporus cinnabarinus TaxID=5643 RepID=A0A060SWE9_PYCCI|nr:Glycoside Hydrolase Family 20 protein [Trametes cinnabarina]
MAAHILRALACLVVVFLSYAVAIWPIPRTLLTGTSPAKLSPNFGINLHGLPSPPADVVAAISRTQSRLRSDSLERLVLGRGSADVQEIGRARLLTSLTATLRPGSPVESIAEETTAAIDSKDESYELSIPDDRGVATLVANSSLGLLRGLTTFEQLWYDHKGTKYTLEAPIHILDEPAFLVSIPRPAAAKLKANSGMNGSFPVADILRTLDAMSWVKLSILYWHVIDSQSFPLEVGAFPELSEKGAYSAEEVYTRTDVQRIVKYANERGIDVVMELDSPGHTTAISAAHPEHVACAAKSPWSKYASEPPAGQLRIASRSTLSFARTLFSSVAAALPGTMMSSGGDEVNLPCWEEDEETVADLARRNITIADALNEFVQTVQGVIKEHGKTPFIKSDMVLTHDVPVLDDTVVVVWQTSEDAAAVANRRLRLIHQPSNYFYLAYSFDPFANLTAAQHALVLGGQDSLLVARPTSAHEGPPFSGQMPLWSEQSSPENLDPIVWPRLAAGAEVFWTGATLPNGSPRLGANATSGTHALARLHELRYRLVDRGVKAIALQPKWCVLRPGECDLDS